MGTDERTTQIDRFLTGLTRFFLHNSAEGAFEVRDVVRKTGTAFGVTAEVLLVAEAAIVTVRHHDGTDTVTAVRAVPQLARLDLVSQSKFLVNAVLAGELTPAAANARLTELETSPQPIPDWVRILGVALFAIGFAPSVQATWREVGSSAVLGLVMGVMVVVAGRYSRLELLLPILGPIVIGVLAFLVLGARNAPGGPVILMVPALFVLIPGDYLCAATAELAVGQFTPGAVRLAQAIFTLVELAVGLIIAAEITRAGSQSLLEHTVRNRLPFWVIALSWIPFTVGLVMTFTARPRDFWWILALVYLAWGTQRLATDLTDITAGTFIAGTALAAAAGILEWSPRRPPRIVLILGGFFALTVGAIALRGLTLLDSGQTTIALNDIRASVTQATALTIGLVLGTLLTVGRPAKLTQPTRHPPPEQP